ncbi:tannase and feruloyl esterase [Colletotrichum karsti]|uniref:Carboxylic ester hydrolase n=1 Tax=Colletotrichum karsti TaxID=1095194 RepID=A0A9P6I949_9PEZI|nr:tannase and feruloyl esterase [Colletotrichum karsti]KAF9879132.1 tannase and feruloyl esterase [Colletotrichum karsti]
MKLHSIITLSSLIGIASAAATCKPSTFTIPNATVITAEHRNGNEPIPLPNTVPSCGGGPSFNVTPPVPICRLVLDVPTSPSSSVRVEAWLPDPATWNSRLLASGTGGIGGCVDYPVLQSGTRLSFAAFGTNAGHDGAAGHELFLGKEGVIEDFGHRAIHVEAAVARDVVRTYYGCEATKRYYQGCSTGGRQGLQEAALYPDDFDGVLVGAPGVDWLRIVASKGILARRVGWPDIGSPAYVRPEQWRAVVAAQVAMLDGLDGVVDGVIDEPARHRFDPQVLACGTGVLGEDVCLGAAQVGSVRRAYEPVADEGGRIVYPAFEIGSDTGVFSDNVVDGRPELEYTILQDFWRGAVYNDTTWTPHAFDTSQMEFAVSLNPGGVNSDFTNLSAFRARGGKVLAYHGRADQTVTSALSSEFFGKVQTTSNLTLDEMDEFYRLFFIPGMRHCSGGRGAWSIGQTWPLDGERLDGRGNALMALVAWVENGTRVDEIVGAGYEGGDVGGGEVVAERKYCPYPLESRWDGLTNSNLSTAWECVLPID